MFKRSKFSLLVFLLGLLLGAGEASITQAEELTQFTCGTLGKSGQLEAAVVMTAGIETVIACEVKGAPSGQSLSALLLGKRQLGNDLSSTSSADVSVGTEAQMVTLTFPAVYQPGAYQYTFSLFDTANQQPLAADVKITGTIQGKAQPKLTYAVVTKESYHWQDEFTFNYALDIPDGYLAEKEGLTMRVAMADEQGGICSVIDPALKPRSTAGSYTLKFPEAGKCINALVFTLTDVSNTVLDEYRLAVPLVIPEKSPVMSETSSSNALQKMNPKYVVGGVLILVLAGLLWYIRRRRMQSLGY